jgi:hypothetical protein
MYASIFVEAQKTKINRSTTMKSCGIIAAVVAFLIQVHAIKENQAVSFEETNTNDDIPLFGPISFLLLGA